MSFDIVSATPAAAVATSGTIVFSYPSGRDAGSYSGEGHVAAVRGLMNVIFSNAGDFSLAFGASNITLTYNGTTSIPANTVVELQINRFGEDDGDPFDALISDRMALAPVYKINLGAPDTADANGVCASQAITAASGGTINGALAAGGVATFDVPRAVVAAWTTTAVMTITGTDEYGAVMKESSASGTSMTGAKAFKTITAVEVSVDVTGATVGTGDVLGLPSFVESAFQILADEATSGTFVAGVTAAATATTGDVRGTYNPNGAVNGTLQYALYASLPDPKAKGVNQYAG